MHSVSAGCFEFCRLPYYPSASLGLQGTLTSGTRRPSPGGRVSVLLRGASQTAGARPGSEGLWEQGWAALQAWGSSRPLAGNAELRPRSLPFPRTSRLINDWTDSQGWCVWGARGRGEREQEEEEEEEEEGGVRPREVTSCNLGDG